MALNMDQLAERIADRAADRIAANVSATAQELVATSGAQMQFLVESLEAGIKTALIVASGDIEDGFNQIVAQLRIQAILLYVLLPITVLNFFFVGYMLSSKKPE
jgi:hypothetical protein